MTIVKFKNGDSEVLVEMDKITYVSRKIRGERFRMVEVVIHFIGGESYTFFGKDAEMVWGYFMENYLWKAPREGENVGNNQAWRGEINGMYGNEGYKGS